MKQKKYLVEEIEQNKLINKKYTKVCTTLNYIQHFLILASVFTGCILVSAFSPSLSIPIGIRSSAIGLKICTLTPGIKKCKSVSKKKKKKHESKLNSDSHVPETFFQIKIIPSVVQKNTIICLLGV